MQKQLPQSFIAFLKTILQAQTSTDRWKSKLFYIPPQKIIDLLKQQQSEDQERNSKQILTIKNFRNFIQRNCTQQNFSLCNKRQQVLSKYFRFYDLFKCSKTVFLNKIKPIDNKLILQVQRSQVQANQCLFRLFQSILDGYQKIRGKRDQCKLEYGKISSYFKSNLDSTCLTKESLKAFMYEAGIYGRVNFNYIQDYVFGQKQHQIQWTTLFKRFINITDQIEELQDENIVSQNLIPEGLSESTNKKFYLGKYGQKQEQQQQQQNQKRLLIESVSQQDFLPQPIFKIQMSVPSNGYNKVHNQISHIEELLNKTKQKYQRNREQLENQTRQIRNSQIKRTGSNEKFTRKSANDYQVLKIDQQREQLSIRKSGRRTLNTNQKQTQQQKTDKIELKVQMQIPLMIQSSVKPFYTRQQMKKQIEQASLQVQRPQRFSHRYAEMRQVEKIKRPSGSKDIQKQNVLLQKSSIFSYSIKNDYDQYEAVMKEINKEQSQYKKLVQKRQKIVYDRQVKHRLDLNAQRQAEKTVYDRQVKHRHDLDAQRSAEKTVYDRQVNHRLGLNAQRQAKKAVYDRQAKHKYDLDAQRSVDKKYTATSYLAVQGVYTGTKSNDQQLKSSSQSRFTQIMKQIQNNTLTKSRVSSKKRQQIVQKATSEARLRIQQIQNRALSRLASLDTQTTENTAKKRHNYINTDTMKEDEPLVSKSTCIMKNTKPKPSLNLELRGKLFMSNLLNERPSIQLSPVNHSKKY